MNVTNFFSDPGAEIMAAYTGVLGIFAFVLILVFLDGYVLIKTESWGAASVVAVLISLIFSAMLPSALVWIWVIAAVFSLAALIVDVFILK